MGKINNRQGLLMGGLQVNRWGNAHLPGLFPSRGAQAPLVAGLKPGKAEFWPRRDQIISAAETVLQEGVGHGHANRVETVVHRAGIAAPIAEKARHWVRATAR